MDETHYRHHKAVPHTMFQNSHSCIHYTHLYISSLQNIDSPSFYICLYILLSRSHV